MKKLIRITTVPSSLRTLLKGQHRFMNSHFKVIGVSGAGEALDEVRQNEGIETHVIEMTRSITPIKDLKATYHLYKFFKKEKPLIVHTHTPKAGIVGMLAAKLAGVKHRFHTVAGMPLLEATGSKRKLLNFVEKLTYKYATKILPNSVGLFNIILNEKFTQTSKLLVIGKGSSNGIDIHHYDVSTVSEDEKVKLKTALKITNSDFIFLFIGRVVKDKGINELIEAFDIFSSENKNCKLILVGPMEDHLDPLLPQTEALIVSNKKILCVGVKKDIRPYVAISHTFVFPSYREGFPNVVMQAGSMGLPCIVSDINGCNEIIENNYNGLIVPPKNVQALIDAMTFILKNPDERQQMALNSREKIVKNYQQECIWESLLKLYLSAK